VAPSVGIFNFNFNGAHFGLGGEEKNKGEEGGERVCACCGDPGLGGSDRGERMRGKVV
jgi:hypothetical protein